MLGTKGGGGQAFAETNLGVVGFSEWHDRVSFLRFAYHISSVKLYGFSFQILNL